MNVILVLSPHLDDAAFSVGPLLAEFSSRAKIVVATVFTNTASILTDFALSCQLDKGLPAEVDYMAIRREEDIVWANRIGAAALHGAFLEAPHRGYSSAQDLFGPLLMADKLDDVLGRWFKELAEKLKPSAILCPIGVGSHVDHVWVRKVAEALFLNKIPLFFFKDEPYSSKFDCLCINDYLKALRPWQELKIPVGWKSLSQAQFAAAAYQSQIPFQFGNIDTMEITLSNAWTRQTSLFHTNSITALDNIFLSTTPD